MPERLRPYIAEPAANVVPAWERSNDRIDLGMVRSAIHNQRKMLLDYSDAQGRGTNRMIWPIMLGYYETTRIICAWCETRKDFRSFRSDRIVTRQRPGRPIPRAPRVAAHQMAQGDGSRLEEAQGGEGEARQRGRGRRGLTQRPMAFTVLCRRNVLTSE